MAVTDAEVLATSEEMATEFRQRPEVIIFGDGSGTTIGNPFAWACFVVNMEAGTVYRITGGGSCGTSNYAELSPYVNAIWWVAFSGSLTGKRRVGIVSDSELTVKCGRREYERRANGHLWAAIEHFEKSGFEIQWHHIRRNTNPVSKDCDLIAGGLRRMFDEGRATDARGAKNSSKEAGG